MKKALVSVLAVAFLSNPNISYSENKLLFIRPLFKGDIIIKEKSKSSPIPFFRSRNVTQGIVKFEIVKSREVNPGITPMFLGGKTKKVRRANAQGIISIPPMMAGTKMKESFLRVKNRGKVKIIRIFTTPKEGYEYIENFYKSKSKAIEFFSETVSVVDAKKFSSEEVNQPHNPRDPDSIITDEGVVIEGDDIKESGILKSTSDEATISTFSDPYDGGGTYLKGIPACAGRPYYPVGQWSSGMVRWASNPGKAGFSVKAEGTSNPNPNSLVCPVGSYRTNTYIDGVYRYWWANKVYKVPNHCSVTRFVLTNNVKGFVCCCNKAMNYIGGVCSNLFADDRRYLRWTPFAGQKMPLYMLSRPQTISS